MSLYRRPGSPYYWSKLHSAGDVVRFSTRERTKVRALRAEREKAAQLEKQRKIGGRFSMATLTAKFLVWKEANNRKPSSVRAMRKHIALHILPFFGAERDVRTIEVKDLEEYKSARLSAVEAATVCKELSTLRQVLRYGAEVHQLMEQAPTTRNPSYRYEPKWKLLSVEQLEALLITLGKFGGRGKEALPYFLLMANTGMRGGELAALTWEMVDETRGSITLPGSVTKTRRPRTVPLNEAAQSALNMLPRRVGRVFHAGHHYDAWRSACESVLGYRVRPHDLRHTFGSLMHAAGRSGPEIRDILGHVTLAMENLYAHTYQEKLHQAVASVVINVPKNVPSNGSTVPKTASKGPKRSGARNARSATVKQ